MYVYALSSCAVRWRDRTIRLTRGTPWRSDDPFVKDRPELFSRKPPVVASSTPASASRDVEQATAAPGEKRRVKKSA